MDDHATFWQQVKNQLVDFCDVPVVFADALIARTTEGDWNKERVIPEQCAGARSEQFCASNWLAAKYWKWRGGSYVGFSYREALESVESYGRAATILVDAECS